jgi:uncharacterized protein YdhG (YjbR/CyaY superfamily)
MSSNIIARLGSELVGYDTSKGTIRFTPDKRLPDALVQRIVTLRIEENLEIMAARAARQKDNKAAAKR